MPCSTRCPPTTSTPPVAAFAYAKRLAQRGISVNALVRAYRLGQQRLLQRAYEFVVSDADLPAGLVTAVFQSLVDDVSDYIDWISQKVAELYEQERESWLANRATARETQVRRIIDGETTDLAAAERILGYGLSCRHIAVIAWTQHTNDHSPDQLGRFTSAIRHLGHILGAKRPCLVIGRDQDTAWGWIPVPADWKFEQTMHRRFGSGRNEREDARAEEDVAGLFSAPRSSVQLATGSAHFGADGFRLSHQEAERVQKVCFAGRTSAALCSHDDPGMAVTSLLATDLEATRSWVRSVLGPLAERTEANERHRSTLLEFLRHDLSYTATAQAMMMHKNSIRYRVESAEAALGRKLTDDRLAIETALFAYDRLFPTD